LLFDGLTVEMISDGKHLPPTLMKLAYKCVGPDRLCAISDATSGAGLPDGARFRMHGMEYEVCDGVGMMLDRSAFAGSTTLLNHAIAVLIRDADIPLPEAVRMVSLVPARIAGVDGSKGSIEAGKDADLIIASGDPLDAKTEVKQLVINGRAIDMSNWWETLYQKFKSRPEK
jgi:N-acetylglucosamine-6-phosphate deacetylase